MVLPKLVLSNLLNRKTRVALTVAAIAMSVSLVVSVTSGYTSIEASEGSSALRVLQSDVRIDLLVTDVGLPGGMNGRQLADYGRIARPALRVGRLQPVGRRMVIPVIVVC